MPLKFPLQIQRFRGVRDEVTAVIVRDAAGRSFQFPCDPDPLRREVAKLFAPDEAEALAKAIARWLTDAGAS